MDLTDIELSACICGYQVCCFCYNRILKSDSPLCPACRRPYTPPQRLTSTTVTTTPSCDHHQNQNNNNKSPKSHTKTKNRKNRKNSNNNNNNNTNKENHDDHNHHHHNNQYHDDCSHHSHLSYDELSSIRVRQKNLVYVVGLPVSLCDEQILKTAKWFGKYGKIKKVYCNIKKSSPHSRTGSFAAFITFYKEKDAFNAIQSMNGYYLDDGRMLKATTGSTKYCSYFLRNSQCSNPSCLYLHDWASKDDVVTKEELNDFGPTNNNSNNNGNLNGHSSSSINHHNLNNLSSINHILMRGDNNSSDRHSNYSYDDREDGGNNGNDEDFDDHSYQNNPIQRSRSHSHTHSHSKSHSHSQRHRVALKATTTSSAKCVDSKISKFDYTRAAKKGSAASLQSTIKSSPPTEYPPLGSSTTPSPMLKPINHNKSSYTKTPPAKPTKNNHTQIRTKPPIGHHTKRRLYHTEYNVNTNNITSKSEKLVSSNKLNHTQQPPKISLDDTQTAITTTTINIRPSKHKKSVNFDSQVDIVGGSHIDNVRIESKNDLKISNKKQKLIKSSMSRSHSQPRSDRDRHQQHTTNPHKSDETVPSSSSKSKSKSKSNKIAAQILLDELLKNNKNDDCMNKKNEVNNNKNDDDNKQQQENNYNGFKLSDLLKDGFVDDDELIMNDYNYYFLQSDEYIFKQFHNHWTYTRQQQKSKA